MLPHALLKGSGEVIDLFISKVTDMTDTERCLLYLSLSFSDLDSKFGIKPLNQTFDIKPGRRNNAGNAVTWPAA